MVYDAVSMHKEKVLSMEVFKRDMELNELPAAASGPGEASPASGNCFSSFDSLPPLVNVESLLIEEALTRADGNQSIAAGLLGISQPALSKRLKKMRTEE